LGHNDVAIEAEGLTKVFIERPLKSILGGLLRGRPPEKKVTVAVDHISFKVQRGEIFCFLGPNGAGKSTTIKMLCTTLLPTEGTACIMGHDIVKEPKKVKRLLGVLPENPERGFEWRLSARQNLRFYADLYRVPNPKKRVEELLELFGLSEHADKWFQKLSRGQRQKVSLARALIADPLVLLLDEPTLGLDVISAREVVDQIREHFGDSERTIFLTTHIVEKAEELADRVGIIHEGKLLAIEDTPRIKSLVQPYDVYVLSASCPNLAEVLIDVQGVLGVTEKEGKFYITIEQGNEKAAHNIIAAAINNGAHIRSFQLEELSLEEAFIRLVKEGGKR